MRRTLGEMFHHRHHDDAPPHRWSFEEWSRSTVTNLLAGTIFGLILALVWLSPRGASDPAGARRVVSPASQAHPIAKADLDSRRTPMDPTGKNAADRARDAALAARFASAKADSLVYSADLHRAAQSKEIDADEAHGRRDYPLAAVLYDHARDGYRLAESRSQFHAASAEKARIDEQVAADARRAAQARARSLYAQEANRADALDDSMRASLGLQVDGAAAAVLGPRIIEVPPEDGEMPPNDDNGPSSLGNAYAVVFSEPIDGSGRGGTWGACWRPDPASARACAKASCEQRSRSDRPCVEIAASKPGEHCVVARAPGFGISSGACSTRLRDAEEAAVARCRSEIAGYYGHAAAPCSVAWTSTR